MWHLYLFHALRLTARRMVHLSSGAETSLYIKTGGWKRTNCLLYTQDVYGMYVYSGRGIHHLLLFLKFLLFSPLKRQGSNDITNL